MESVGKSTQQGTCVKILYLESLDPTKSLLFGNCNFDFKFIPSIVYIGQKRRGFERERDGEGKGEGDQICVIDIADNFNWIKTVLFAKENHLICSLQCRELI